MKKTILALAVLMSLSMVFLASSVSAIPSSLANGSFETGDLTGWTVASAPDFAGVVGTDVFTWYNSQTGQDETVTVTPFSGVKMLRLGTPGTQGQPPGNNAVTQDFTVTQSSLTFGYNIFTRDYEPYNHFHYRLTDLTTATVIRYYEQTAWTDPNACRNCLKSTGWQTVNIDLSAYVGHVVRLEYACGGTGDTRYNTWAYVDGPDDIPPVTVATPSPAANGAGWNNADVTITLAATDNPGGTGVQDIHYRIDGGAEVVVPGATAPVLLTTEGPHTVTFYARDNGGNIEAPAQSISVKIDKTPPAVTATRTPAPNAEGWNNVDITVHFEATDALSGLDTVNSDITVSTEGANQSATGTATDKAGNTGSATLGGINIDKTSPAVSGTVTPAPNAGGWNNTDITVHFEATDALSGVATTSPDVPLSAEGAGQSASGTATDKAGNTGSGAVNNINIDKTKPTLTFGAATPAANGAGWHKSDVTMLYTASDSLSGVASATPTSPLSFTTEGAGQTQTVTVADQAGNSQTFTSPPVNLDKTPPAVSFGAASPAPNPEGWNNTDVSVPFVASDSLSGVASATPTSPLSFTTEGAGQTQTVTVADQAGNSQTFTSPPVNLDKTPPAVSFGAASPAPNPEGWNNTDVSVPFVASDSLSGVASATPSSPVLLSSEGAAVSSSVAITDVAGNTASADTPSFKIDKTPPAVTATRTPAPNPEGWNNADVAVHFEGADALSGVATVSPDVTVSAEGAGQSATGTAADKAGNSATATVGGINIDKTPPTISGTRTPGPNGSGWNNTDVTVHFTATDALSGIASVTPDVLLSTDGSGQQATGTVTDRAGNTASATVSGINIDKTPPAVTATRTPAPNAGGWNNSDVTVHFEATDALSGVATVSPDVTVSTEGASQSATGTATDVAGNSGSATISGINIDKTPPVLNTQNVTVEANTVGGANYTPVAAATDNLDPAPHLTLSPGPGLFVLGNTTVNATAADAAGNTTAGTFTVTVRDTTPPPVVVSSPQAWSYPGTSLIPVTYTATDICDPTLAVSMTLDGVAFTGSSIDPSTLAVGSHTLVVSAADDSGNTGRATVAFTVEAASPTSGFFIRHLIIHWEKDFPDHDTGNGKWDDGKDKGKDISKGNDKGKDNDKNNGKDNSKNPPAPRKGDDVSIWGRFQLPANLTVARLQKSAEVTVTIAGSAGKDTVTFTAKPGKEKDVTWQYQKGNREPVTGSLDIDKMTIWWAPATGRWAGWASFHVEGILRLAESVGGDTTPAQATVALKIPATGGGSFTGQETVECNVSQQTNLWTYHVRTGLPNFPFDLPDSEDSDWLGQLLKRLGVGR